MEESNEGTEMMTKSWIEIGRHWLGLLAALSLAVLVAGCGGGGSGTNGDTQSVYPLTVSPAVINTGPNTVWTITVVGGTRPYRAQSSNPALVVLEKESLTLSENTFRIRALDPHGKAEISVMVYDSEGRTTPPVAVTIDSGTVSELTAIPATLTVYSNSPALVVASGGAAPYRLVSGNPAIIPTSNWSSSGDFLVMARNVGTDTEIELTLQDASGQAAKIATTVKPAPLLNLFKITPVAATPGAGCGSAVCSGQDGTAEVYLRSFEGGPLAGRQVRFDVVQGQYLFYSDNPAQPLVNTTTVTSDQNGLAIVRFKANVNAVTGAALIRATDLVTGNQVNGSFVIAQFTDGTGTLSIIPDEVEITAYYDDECSNGVSSTYYVFGGTPPYRVVTSFPQGLTLTGTPVQTNGGGFTATTRGACMDPANLIVTDATGRTLTALLRNNPGDNARPTDPAPIPALVITPSTANLSCGQTGTFVLSGGVSGTGTSIVAASTNLGVTATVSGRTLSVAIGSGAAYGTDPDYTIYVSDGTNIVTLLINNTNTGTGTCP